MVIDEIKRKLSEALLPDLLDIIDESALHKGHAGVPAGSSGETHFLVRIVAGAFEGMSRVKRHQWIYALLKEELRHPVHALSLHVFTPDEYRKTCS